ncbi:histidine kinase [Micromonospora sp. NPDC049559]|uniref:sensor histidine kinase n=1 Tax=Micromonospora sp. NPDC049559 TaxID=3155923 RepID=UPI0034180327
MTRARYGWVLLPFGLATLGLALSGNLLGWAAEPTGSAGTGLAPLAGVALTAVRRWPFPVLLTEVLLLLLTDALAPSASDMAQLAIGVALGFVAYTAGWPRTVAAFVLACAATGSNFDPAMLEGKQGVVRVLSLLAFAAVPVAFGRYLRAVQDAARVAAERAREAEERRAVELRAVRLAERSSIARELHDIVAHHVAAIALRAGAAQYAVRHTGAVDDAVRALGELRGTASQVLDELRELLEVLRDPDALDPTGSGGTAPGDPTPGGGAGSLTLVEPEQIVADAERRVRAAGLTVRMELAEEVAAAPLVVRTTAARVIQEGLTNTLKHAGPGAGVTVRARPDAGDLLVEVVDGGPARPPGEEPVAVPRATLPPSGHGLVGLNERVGLLGGVLTAGPDEAGGWRLRARLPIRAATDPAAVDAGGSDAGGVDAGAGGSDAGGADAGAGGSGAGGVDAGAGGDRPGGRLSKSGAVRP